MANTWDDVQGVLTHCSEGCISLRVEGAKLVASPRSRVTPELASALRENKAAIIVALAPLGDPRFELERALCACGNAVFVFDGQGRAHCQAHLTRDW